MKSTFSDEIVDLARQTLAEARARGLKIVTAESCTGGLVAAALTDIPGSSEVFERGFSTYSNLAKHQVLGVPEASLAQFGAVSKPVALAMAQGALMVSAAHVALAITGIAGPGGGTADKPVGLVHFAVARREGVSLHEEMRFGDLGRAQVRLQSVVRALTLALKAMRQP